MIARMVQKHSKAPANEPPAPPEVRGLVERFDLHSDDYRAASGGYNETQIRREFIDPLFKSLGWDIDNTSGYAEAYKDVIHEDAIKIGSATKAPDYCFRIGGTRKFFLEAKKPSVDIKGDPSPAYQLRRYAWSAKLPLSILTDFEELAVYDCRVKPKRTDKSSVARILYMRYDELTARWRELASIFSREAVLRGSFDKFAQSTRRKRGTAEVDDAFLEEIECWREALAVNIALRNGHINRHDLNFAVQRTIDRIIFLRMCEDRGIEPYGALLALTNGAQVYDRLNILFRAADARYNSGLFHFASEKGRAEVHDELTPSLTIDDAVLKDIIRRLYYPESPYEFSVISPEILGQVYEQFLGKVITLTPGHRAKIQEKPEVRKAGGVYYTPAYIVHSIVHHTIGRLLGDFDRSSASARDTVRGPSDQGSSTRESPAAGGADERRRRKPMTPKDSATLRILDPACGSGSFLIGAYQYLLDWHLRWYLTNDLVHWAKQRRPPIGLNARGEYRLTTAERKRILLNNIYGVDIDAQAVEVTKLALLLKVLEGESQDSIERQKRFFHERALPDLGHNIKCGNSLIGPDFYHVPGKQMSLLDDEVQRRINVFDWAKDFAPIMEAGGFTCVIGNPPYIRMEAFKELKEYLSVRFAVHADRADLYAYFVERGHLLLRPGGVFGMILSNKFIRARYGYNTRRFITDAAKVLSIIDLAGLPVFRGATVRTVILVTERGGGEADATYSPPLPLAEFMDIQSGIRSLDASTSRNALRIASGSLKPDGWILHSETGGALLARLASTCARLEHAVPEPICYGVKSGLVGAFVVSGEVADRLRRSGAAARSVVRPYITGRQVRRYAPSTSDLALIYTYHGIDVKGCEQILEHLRPFKSRLLQRATRQEWYELQQPQQRYVGLMSRPKLIYPDIANECRFTLDVEGYICGDTTFAIPLADLTLLGILNSRLAFFYFRLKCVALEGANDSYLRFKRQYVAAFPLPRDRNPGTAGAIQEYVETMLGLHKKLAAAKTPYDTSLLERQIDATDRQIDRLVYELYGLTEDEIGVIEEATE